MLDSGAFYRFDMVVPKLSADIIDNLLDHCALVKDEKSCIAGFGLQW